MTAFTLKNKWGQSKDQFDQKLTLKDFKVRYLGMLLKALVI